MLAKGYWHLETYFDLYFPVKPDITTNRYQASNLGVQDLIYLINLTTEPVVFPKYKYYLIHCLYILIFMSIKILII